MSESNEAHRHALLEQLMERAMTTCPDRIHEAHYAFAGHAVRIRVVGDQLAEQLALTFGHLRRSESARSHLTIDLWDQRETGVRSPLQVPSNSLDLSPWLSISEDNRFVMSVLRQSITSFDRRQKRIVGVALDADRLSLYERGRPLHVPLSFWHADRGVPLVHAALVSQEGCGILLAGSARAGKTVSSLACAAAGFHYLADDLTGLEIRADGTVWGHSVFGSAFVDERTLLRSPAYADLSRRGTYDHEHKQLLFVTQIRPMKLAAQTKICAIVLLQNTGADTPSIQPATKSETLVIMIQNAMRNITAHAREDDFELLGRLSEAIPSFWLRLGNAPEETPHQLKRILETTRRSTNGLESEV